MKKKILLGILIVFVAMQFIKRTDKSVPQVDANKDFLLVNSAPDKMTKVFKMACYDCHSYETRYPWYSNVAPMSWAVAEHISHGREELNLALWSDYSKEEQDEKMEDIIEAFEKGWMPLGSYTLIHREALLPFNIRYEVADWLKSL